MNSLERLRSRLTVNTLLVCIENTYIPDRAGCTWRLTRVNKTDAKAVPPQGLFMSGILVSINLPTRVRDVEWIDEDTVRWVIYPKQPETFRHTVTYQIVHSDSHDVLTRKDVMASPPSVSP